MNVANKPRHIKLRGGGYHAVHKWLYKHYGSADHCENLNCDNTSTTYHWAKVLDKPYAHNRDNFKMLCAKCHRHMDLTKETIDKMAHTLALRTNQAVCRNGHPRTPENTYWAKRRLVVAPVCRDCRNESNRRYYASR